MRGLRAVLSAGARTSQAPLCLGLALWERWPQTVRPETGVGWN